MTNDNIPPSGTTPLMVTGSVIGAIVGGVPGAIFGGILGAIIDEFKRCPICGNQMFPLDPERKIWRCRNCKHIERNY